MLLNINSTTVNMSAASMGLSGCPEKDLGLGNGIHTKMGTFWLKGWRLAD